MCNLFAGLAHLVERRSCKADVVSSIPTTGTRETRDPVHVINGGRAVTIESARYSML